MQIPSPRPAGSTGNLLPMINVVFLLLIFFLISAQLAPPEPFAVTPPQAEAASEAQGEFTLHLAADGILAFHDTQSPAPDADAAVLAALAAQRTAYCAQNDCTAESPRLMLRADAQTGVARLAALLPQLGQMGFAVTDLVVRAGEAG